MIDVILSIYNRLNDVERRLARMIRHGSVADVNAAEGWVRLDLGEGDDGPLLSAKVPYAQIAGDLKLHSTPSKGQNMTLFSPGGDPRQAVALPMTWSDQNPSPSDKADEHVLTFGQVRFDLTADQMKLTIGGFSLTVSASAATFSIDGVTHEISGGGVATDGGQVTHDGHDTGATHKHPGIQRGGSLTDPPQ